MKVNSNICALPGLLPFISVTFRRSSGYCRAQFLSGRSCILLTAAERWHVRVCWWKSPGAFGQPVWTGRCLCVRVNACWGQWGIGYCPAAGGLHVGSSEAEMILLGTPVVSCHVNDPCERMRCGAQLVGSSGFPVCAKGATPMPNGSSAEGKDLSGASLTLLPGFGQGVLGEECSTLTCAEQQTLFPACVWSKC